MGELGGESFLVIQHHSGRGWRGVVNNNSTRLAGRVGPGAVWRSLWHKPTGLWVEGVAGRRGAVCGRGGAHFLAGFGAAGGNRETREGEGRTSIT